jgi:hypothetical protein
VVDRNILLSGPLRPIGRGDFPLFSTARTLFLKVFVALAHTVVGDQGNDLLFGQRLGALRIPAQAGHGFQSKLDSDSDGSWTPIPGQAGQPEVIT